MGLDIPARWSCKPRIYAFDMKTKQRVSDKDFELSYFQRPDGIWSNGETMWVADSGARKIYAYDMQTKAPVPAKEFETLGVGASPYCLATCHLVERVHNAGLALEHFRW